jgi:transcriptional regulator GlxA family with amidase domain
MVRRGKVITAAGVSASIDMALALAAEIEGPEFAKTLQLIMEYDPQRPVDAGSPAKAGPELVGAAFTAMAGVMQRLQSA